MRATSAVGAVYDRAFVPLGCENRAVIDRAYSRTRGKKISLGKVDVEERALSRFERQCRVVWVLIFVGALSPT